MRRTGKTGTLHYISCTRPTLVRNSHLEDARSVEQCASRGCKKAERGWIRASFRCQREREREMERGKEKNRGNKRERRKLRDAAPGVATPVSSMSKKHRLSPLLSTILRFHFTRVPSSSSFSARVLLLDICLFV